jgi:hypothetical protein
MADPCWEDLLVDGVSLQSLGLIVSAEGLLSTGPTKGDLILQDWTPGAIWQQGPPDTYSFEVPVVMKSRLQDVAIGMLRTLQSWQGTKRTLIRRLTVDGVQIEETCQAVIVSAPQVVWDFRERQKISCVLVFQNLSGVWDAVA